MKQLYRCLPFFLFLFAGCRITDPSEDIPSYLAIDTMDVLIANPSKEGTWSHKLTDCWVYLDNKLHGVFEMPFTIPVIAGEDTRVSIRGGIKMNGISSTRIAYPFFEFDHHTVDFTPLDTVKIQPRVFYYPTTRFLYLEEFEQGTTIETLDGSDTSLFVRQDPDQPFLGTGYGAIVLDGSNDSYKGRSKGSAITLPAGSPTVFLELNYRCNNPFYINFGATFPDRTVEVPVLRINEETTWNKIYINFSPYARDFNGAADYFFILTAVKDSALTEAFIHIDNLKLITSE